MQTHSRSLSRRTRIRAAFRGRRRAAITTCVISAVAAIAATPSPATALRIDGPAGDSADHVSTAQLRGQLVREALRHRGTPYVWGGSTPSGFDCSGFTSYVYGRFGTSMAHSTYAQFEAYPRVARDDLKPGDIVFFAGVGHNGIYIGNGRFVHSPRTGKSVEVQRLNGSWYRTTYVGAVRPPIRPRLTTTVRAERSAGPAGV